MKNTSSNLKLLIVALSFTLLAYSLTPWTNTANAVTEQTSTPPESSSNESCSKILAITQSNQKTLATLERLIGYLESSVTDIKMTVNGIDRKQNTADRLLTKKKTI